MREFGFRRLIMVLAVAVPACQPSGPASKSDPAARSETAAKPEAVPAEEIRGDAAEDSRWAFDVGEIRAVQDYLSEPRFAAADLERGRILSLSCQACHTLGAGEDHNLGPNLYGMFGRQAAQLKGFGYSDALRSSGLVWTPQALEAWLAEPADFVPGNNMVFAGFSSETDRRDVLAYLLRATSGLE